jgi:hypothetical protein
MKYFKISLRQQLENAQRRHVEEAVIVPRLQKRDVAQVTAARLQNARDLLRDQIRTRHVLRERGGVNHVEAAVGER